MKLFRRSAAPTLPPRAVVAVAQPIVLAGEGLTFDATAEIRRATSRIDAIMQDRKRRTASSLSAHPDHVAMTGEAIELVGTLVRKGAWNVERALETVKTLVGAP
ncbi:MAG: hypothetical protein ACREFX_07445 [Opitutaceae bacterium]